MSTKSVPNTSDHTITQQIGDISHGILFVGLLPLGPHMEAVI